MQPEFLRGGANAQLIHRAPFEKYHAEPHSFSVLHATRKIIYTSASVK